MLGWFSGFHTQGLAGLEHFFLPLSFRDNTLIFLFPPFFLSQDEGAGRPLANDFKAGFRKWFQGARLGDRLFRLFDSPQPLGAE